MSSLGFSQTGFPRQILYEGHRVIAITEKQMQHINNAHLSWLECREESDSLLKILDICQESFTVHDSIVHAKDQQLALRQSSILERDQLISAHQDLLKSKNKEIKKLTTQKKILCISTGVFGVAAIVLLILL